MENSLRIQFTYAIKNLLGLPPVCSQVYSYTDFGSPEHQKAQRILWNKPGSGSRQPSYTSGNLFLEATPVDRNGQLYSLAEVDTRRAYLESMNRNLKSIHRQVLVKEDNTTIFTAEEVKEKIKAFEEDMDSKCGPDYDFYQYSQPSPANQPLQKYQQMKL